MNGAEVLPCLEILMMPMPNGCQIVYDIESPLGIQSRVLRLTISSSIVCCVAICFDSKFINRQAAVFFATFGETRSRTRAAT